MKKQVIAAFGVVLCAAMGSGYLHFENTALQTTEYTVAFDTLPQRFSGYRIAQISDFHNAQSQTLNRKLREAVRQAKPDIIVFTGDLIDRTRTDLTTAVSLVHDLRDTAPMYFVCGNHDARSEAYETLVERLQSEGVRVLANETVLLQRGTDAICLAGVDDPARSDQLPGNRAVLKREIESLPRDASFTILLTHRPDTPVLYAEENMDLVLAGHAHGGQMRLPFAGGLYAPSQGVFPLYTEGVCTRGNMQMVISRGVGNSAFPFRVNNRPELVVVTLEKKS